MPPQATSHRHPAAVACPDCGDAVLQVHVDRGAGALLVDADPDRDGGTVLVTLDAAGVPRGGQVTPGQAAGMRAAGRDLHAPHAVSCPYASRPARSRPGAQRAARARR